MWYGQVMTQLADQIASSRPPFRSNKQAQYVTSMSIVAETQGQGGTYKGLAALFGHPKDQLALSVFSLLPWLCLHFQHTPFTPIAQACIKVSCSGSPAVSHAHRCHLLNHERYADGTHAILADQAVAFQLPSIWAQVANHTRVQSHHLFCMQALRSACEKLRLIHVSDGLAALSAHAQQDLPSLLAMLCPPLCAAFFPRYSRTPVCVPAEQHLCAC